MKDEHGVTLPGVSVLIKGESVGVATDINGKYSITIPENKKEVVFAFLVCRDDSGRDSIYRSGFD